MRKLLLVAAIVTACCSHPAAAADYPNRPITFVVPFAAGGPTDVLARTMAERMSAVLKQSVVVENMPAAGGSVGVGHVVQAAPDGYTISVGNWSTHVLNGAIYSLSYDLVTDLAPVVRLPSSPQLIVARKSLEANTLGELTAWLKSHPANIGTAGVGSAGHVSALLYQKQNGGQFSYAHYRGAGPAMIDLVGGHIDVMFDQSANSLPHVRTGAIKAYAVTSATRLAPAPNIPTVDEAGLPGFHVAVWHGLWAPKATPADVVAKLNAAAREVMERDPAVREKFAALGQSIPEPDQLAPAALMEWQKAEIAKWWPVLKAANVKAE
ncbi:tripartite tricarboxylate transporter substrate-binding protein [Rhodoplanes sp. Z2-YC6860]|uniref:tripartite tricarboxylate transporter substrate-binding protein n=1 Tax=Rhodoplanes sp. Z2-YC6860 TaxID=674703 RepID=UPI00078CFF6C|nr:tripartite tricarboxylate transporter substrate-binding protein [Rhodoplanes sp. Z2-YC6860]AMN40610.1 ABC transporter substrate-binding protein [Rhodoplanes sp. Z2-YC6860]